MSILTQQNLLKIKLCLSSTLANLKKFLLSGPIAFSLYAFVLDYGKWNSVTDKVSSSFSEEEINNLFTHSKRGLKNKYILFQCRRMRKKQYKFFFATFYLLGSGKPTCLPFLFAVSCIISDGFISLFASTLIAFEFFFSGSVSQIVKLIFACPDNIFPPKTENEPCANHTATVCVRIALYKRMNLQYVQHILKTQSHAFMYKAHCFKMYM